MAAINEDDDGPGDRRIRGDGACGGPLLAEQAPLAGAEGRDARRVPTKVHTKENTPIALHESAVTDLLDALRVGREPTLSESWPSGPCSS